MPVETIVGQAFSLTECRQLSGGTIARILKRRSREDCLTLLTSRAPSGATSYSPACQRRGREPRSEERPHPSATPSEPRQGRQHIARRVNAGGLTVEGAMASSFTLHPSSFAAQRIAAATCRRPKGVSSDRRSWPSSV